MMRTRVDPLCRSAALASHLPGRTEPGAIARSRPPMQPGRRCCFAFTRLELLVVLAALTLLGSLALAGVTPSVESNRRVVCANNLRQMGRALFLYAGENLDAFPARSQTNRWPQRLLAYYSDTNLLHCPSDPRASTVHGSPLSSADAAPRSYLYNGWNDWFQASLDWTAWVAFQNHQYSGGMPLSAITKPAATITFGEKYSASFHFTMDFMNGIGGDLTEVEHGRHTLTDRPQDGGSNHAMADGSVQFLKYGLALTPENLWAVTDVWRTNTGVAQ